MPRIQYRRTPITPFGEKGIYSKDDWLKESRLHLLSANMLRECSALKKVMIASQTNLENQSNVLMLVSQREAANKSSILLIGYAFEMLLKSGLVCLYVDVPRETLLRDIKGTYKHKLRKIANEIEVPLNEYELSTLDRLSKWIIDHARYPITPENEVSYNKQWNELIRKFWNDVQFKELLSLYEQIYSHVSEIDASSDDPKSSSKWSIDDDGYVIYRIGGKLKDRIIVRYSSEQRENGDDNRESLKALLLNNINNPVYKEYLSRDWDTIVYKEIK